MNRRRLAVALVAVFLASFLVVGLFRLYTAPPQPPTPTPTTTATPADPLVWYRSLPTASGCPKSVAAGLKPFYPQCPNVSEDPK